MNPTDSHPSLDGLRPATVAGHWVTLRPISQADFPTLFNWRTNLLDLHLWNSPRRVPTWEEFCTEIERIARQSVFFLVTTGEKNEPIGYVQAYNLNAAEGWCFTAAYITEPYRRAPQAAEAYIALLEYLFRSFPFRKIYADVFEFNIHPLKPLTAGGFVEEGCFKKHSWHDDRYWDVHRLAMYREGWDAVRDRARSLLRVGEDAATLLAEQKARNGGHAE